MDRTETVCVEKILSSMSYVISYRKKDYSQMKRIYEALVKQGLQVFVDEFLAPLDTTYDEVKSAYKKACKAGAIILLLSENSLEPSNYQMNFEYPMAQKIGGDIIPVWIGVVSLDLVKEQICLNYSGLYRDQIIDGEGDISRVPGKIMDAIEEVRKSYLQRYVRGIPTREFER